MTIDQEYRLVRNIKTKYLRVGRNEKGADNGHIAEATELGRKYLITLLNGPEPIRGKRRRQRGRRYGAKVDGAIPIIGSTLDWICAERLTPVLVEIAPHLERHDEKSLDDE